MVRDKANGKKREKKVDTVETETIEKQIQIYLLFLDTIEKKEEEKNLLTNSILAIQRENKL